MAFTQNVFWNPNMTVEQNRKNNGSKNDPKQKRLHKTAADKTVIAGGSEMASNGSKNRIKHHDTPKFDGNLQVGAVGRSNNFMSNSASLYTDDDREQIFDFGGSEMSRNGTKNRKKQKKTQEFHGNLQVGAVGSSNNFMSNNASLYTDDDREQNFIQDEPKNKSSKNVDEGSKQKRLQKTAADKKVIAGGSQMASNGTKNRIKHHDTPKFDGNLQVGAVGRSNNFMSNSASLYTDDDREQIFDFGGSEVSRNGTKNRKKQKFFSGKMEFHRNLQVGAVGRSNNFMSNNASLYTDDDREQIFDFGGSKMSRNGTKNRKKQQKIQEFHENLQEGAVGSSNNFMSNSASLYTDDNREQNFIQDEPKNKSSKNVGNVLAVGSEMASNETKNRIKHHDTPQFDGNLRVGEVGGSNNFMSNNAPLYPYYCRKNNFEVDGPDEECFKNIAEFDQRTLFVGAIPAKTAMTEFHENLQEGAVGSSNNFMSNSASLYTDDNREQNFIQDEPKNKSSKNVGNVLAVGSEMASNETKNRIKHHDTPQFDGNLRVGEVGGSNNFMSNNTPLYPYYCRKNNFEQDGPDEECFKNIAEFEQRTLFVGAIPAKTAMTDVLDYFTKYGEVEKANLKMYHNKRNPNLYSIVTFSRIEAAEKALAEPKHIFKDKRLHVHTYEPRFGKVQVRGITKEMTEDHLVDYFNKFGKVIATHILVDKETNQVLPIGFITFKNEIVAKLILQIRDHFIGGEKVELKPYIPKRKLSQRPIQYCSEQYEIPPENYY